MNDLQKQNMEIPKLSAGKDHMIKPLKDLNLMDDFLFDVTTMDLDACRIILELSLGIKIKKLQWKEGQKEIRNLPGKRAVRLDFCAEDEQGNLFDVEMQKRNWGNLPKRTRFYQALLDAPMLKSGEEGFDGLKPLYIILICGFDLFGCKKYRYTFENYCEEVPGLNLGDGCKKIVLNTRGENDGETERSLIDFLRYVEKSSAENVPEDCDMRLKELHKKVQNIKSSEEMEVTYMKAEERERLIREESKREGKEELLTELVRDGIISEEEASKRLQISLEETDN